MSNDIEALADEVHRDHIAGQRRPRGHVEHPETESKARMGRPPVLSHSDEWELYCYRKSGVAIKTCASFFRVSVPTVHRIIAKFKAYDARVEPIAREFREKLASVRDST
jgi:hypothetical protein